MSEPQTMPLPPRAWRRAEILPLLKKLKPDRPQFVNYSTAIQSIILTTAKRVGVKIATRKMPDGRLGVWKISNEKKRP